MRTPREDNTAPHELVEIRAALADAERRLNDARLLHAMQRGPAPDGLEEDVAVLRAEELRLSRIQSA